MFRVHHFLLTSLSRDFPFTVTFKTLSFESFIVRREIREYRAYHFTLPCFSIRLLWTLNRSEGKGSDEDEDSQFIQCVYVCVVLEYFNPRLPMHYNEYEHA